jgi:hypothetical protein
MKCVDTAAEVAAEDVIEDQGLKAALGAAV